MVRPRLEAGDLPAGADFFLAHSPERIDPGRPRPDRAEHPEGGRCTTWSPITVVPVSSPRTAEMVKLLENTLRAINIGLVNEVALLYGETAHHTDPVTISIDIVRHPIYTIPQPTTFHLRDAAHSPSTT